MVEQNFPYKGWTIKYFLEFFCETIFKTLGYDPRGVLGGLERADRSLLMADSSKASSRCAIGRILS